LRSKLSADYSQEGSQGVLGAFRLSIIGDALRDLGLTPKEADQQTAGIKIALNDPVPTATALNFEGDDPYTATPTATPTFTNTPTNTPTSTPTTTPRPTKTPLPTSTKKPALPTATPGDSTAPVIADPGTLNPTLGYLGTSICSVNVDVLNAHITDVAPSSGIKKVRIKYKVYDEGGILYNSYVYSSNLTMCPSGGFTPSGGFDACYDGPNPKFTLSISPGFSTTINSGPDLFEIHVWLIVEDNKGLSDTHFYGFYTADHTCDG
jgi:hypothetical protein